MGIVGEYDRLTTPQRMAELVALIPRAELKTIKSAGHLPNIEQPEIFNQVLLEFLLSVK